MKTGYIVIVALFLATAMSAVVEAGLRGGLVGERLAGERVIGGGVVGAPGYYGGVYDGFYGAPGYYGGVYDGLYGAAYDGFYGGLAGERLVGERVVADTLGAPGFYGAYDGFYGAAAPFYGGVAGGVRVL